MKLLCELISNLKIKHRPLIPTCSITMPLCTTTTAHTKPQQTTVNDMEIQKFSSNSYMWWDLNSPMKGLHTLNKLRVPFIIEALKKQIGQNLNKTKILDIGCGGGILSEALSTCGASVTGIDASQDAIIIAREHSERNEKLVLKPSYYCTTIEEHIITHNDYYDAVVASEVIEHIDNKEYFVKVSIEALKPGGRIFYTTPNKTRRSQFINIWFAEYIMNTPPKGTHEYEKFITANDLQYLLEINGCHTELIRGCYYNVIKNTWFWNDSISLFYAIQAVKQLNKDK